MMSSNDEQNAATGKRGVRPLSSVLKTLKVLETLAGARREMSLSETAQAVAMSRGSVYQKLVTLREAGWVEQSAGGRFRLTLAATRIGNAALEQASLGERVTPFLEQLVEEVGETASLAVLDGGVPYIVQRVEAHGVLRVDLRVGTPLSLAESASGRVLVAYLADTTIAKMRAQGIELPPAEVIEAVRREGFITSSGLSVPGVRAIAAPVFDARQRCVATLSLVAPTSRFDMEACREPLLRFAGRITQLLQGEA